MSLAPGRLARLDQDLAQLNAILDELVGTMAGHLAHGCDPIRCVVSGAVAFAAWPRSQVNAALAAAIVQLAQQPKQVP